ncbi:MAG TPA: phosphatidylcholine/phosphatidylserine synthase [Opitutaceae bacterium]|jgi:CDP-diacylglycerol--serine O-phosphatidyltransferase
MIFPRRKQDSYLAEDLASRADPYNVKQASRIYLLPNLMTGGNLFCGFMAVVSCIHARLAATAEYGLYLGGTSADHYRYAVYFIFGAALFDMLDGRLARMGGRESLFGAEFDSIADVVSFGLSPALLMFCLILAPSQQFPWFRNIGWAVGFIFLGAAAVRLARFNVITNPLLHQGKKESSRDFVGLPVPAAAGTVASLVLCLLKLGESDKSLSWFALGLPFLMLLIAFLMVSTIRYPSGKNVDLLTQTRLRTFVIVLVGIVLMLLFKEIALLGLFLFYIFYGIIRRWRRPKVRKAPRPAGS